MELKILLISLLLLHSAKKSNKLFAICCVSSFGSNNGEGISGCSDKTIPFTFAGSTLIPISPIRSRQLCTMEFLDVHLDHLVHKYHEDLRML